MITPPAVEEHFGVTVMVDKAMDILRRDRCLCLRCRKEGDCSTASQLYEICRGANVALAITRCPYWRGRA